MAAAVTPFKIAVPDSALKSLHDKLNLTTLPDEVDFSNDWAYGVPRDDIQRLVNYWKDGFDWRAAEAKLNEIPQYKTTVSVDGFGPLGIHFVHQKSSKPGSIPLLFCHGWPGSFIEVIKILPLLTNPETGPSFHVVAPSLPNYGFSDKVHKKGFGIPKYAEALHKVMLRLGYDKYVTQGGDWGYMITRLIGIQFPESCLASHLNLILATSPPAFTTAPLQYLRHALLPYSAAENAGRIRSAWFEKEGFGYNLLQSTKPSTVGIALASSPSALLAWIYEKLHDWTDSYPWTDDEILTWISIYQFSTAGPAASVRIYYENYHDDSVLTQALGWVPHVQLGYSYFPKDLFIPPKTWARALGPVVFEAEHEDGGHFAAHERPEVLAEDLRRMFGEDGGASAVAKRFA